MSDELEGLSGGQKRMWLRQHRDEVLEYLEGHGEEATKEKYHLKHDTLDRVIQSDRGQYPEFTRYDRLEMRLNMATAGVEDLRGEVRELTEQFAKFQETVGDQLRDKFFLPLIQRNIEIGEDLQLKPKPDPLSLEDVKEPTKLLVLKEAEAIGLEVEERMKADKLAGMVRVKLWNGKTYLIKKPKGW